MNLWLIVGVAWAVGCTLVVMFFYGAGAANRRER